jgi:hypothetical protein
MSTRRIRLGLTRGLPSLVILANQRYAAVSPPLQPRRSRGHRPLLLDWFRAKGHLSSGVVERYNAKAKLTTRKAHGLRTCQGTRLISCTWRPTRAKAYPQILLRRPNFYFYCVYLKAAPRLQIETQDTIWAKKHESIRTINRYTC